MSVEAFILKWAEKSLAPYRVRAQACRDAHTEEYAAYEPKIQRCLEAASYWHGTGRYHYQYEGQSRYERVSTNATLDILDSIVTKGGLIPHIDPWVDSGGETVSLGTVRMHSRLFARIHLYEKDSLLFELGSIKYWVRFYGVLLFVWLMSDLGSCRQFLKSLFRKSSYNDLQAWAGAIRKPRGKTVVSVMDFMTGTAPGCDIEGNYPVLFGVAKGTLEVMETIALVHAVEVRSLHSVTLKDFTHVEVPLDKVQQTKDFLNSRGVTLEVLPLEFVDIYLRSVPVRKLAYT